MVHIGMPLTQESGSPLGTSAPMYDYMVLFPFNRKDKSYLTSTLRPFTM